MSTQFLINDTSCKLYLNNELYPYIYQYHSLFNNNELLHFNSDIGDLVIEYYPENKIYHIKYERLLKLDKNDYNIIGFIICPSLYDIYGTGEYLVQSIDVSTGMLVENDKNRFSIVNINKTADDNQNVTYYQFSNNEYIISDNILDYSIFWQYKQNELSYGTGNNVRYLNENILDILNKYNGIIPYTHRYYPEGYKLTKAYKELYTVNDDITYRYLYKYLINFNTQLTTEDNWFLPSYGEIVWAILYNNMLYNFYYNKCKLTLNSLNVGVIFTIYSNNIYSSGTHGGISSKNVYISSGFVGSQSNSAYSNIVLFTKGKWPELII